VSSRATATSAVSMIKMARQPEKYIYPRVCRVLR